MARIWANRIEAGTFSMEQCPAYRHEAVKEVMRQDVESGRGGMTAEKYEQITGEKYEKVTA